MGASLALVAHTFELSRFQPSQSLRWTQAIKLSIAYCLKIRGSYQVPRGQDHAFDNSSAHTHSSVKHRAFQCLNWILHETSGYLTR